MRLWMAGALWPNGRVSLGRIPQEHLPRGGFIPQGHLHSSRMPLSSPSRSSASPGTSGSRSIPRRRRRWPLYAGGVLVLVAATAWLVLALVGARDDLVRARSAMEAGRAALVNAEVVAGWTAFGEAERRFSSASRTLSAAPFDVLQRFPGGHELRLVRGLAEAGSLTANAGVLTAAALPDDLATFAPQEGRIPLEPMRALEAPLASAADQLEEARQVVLKLPRASRISQVQAARDELAENLAEAAPAVRRAAALVRALPQMLGADEPQRYLFGASNPAELRGAGSGLVGAVSILTIDDGRLDFGNFRSITQLPVLDPAGLEPPNSDFARRYDEFNSRGFFSNINLSPDLPAVAVAMERLYAAGTGHTVDGTILADPFVVKALLELTGPTRVPNQPVLLDADNVVAYMTNEAYADFDTTGERQEILGEVAAAVVRRFLEGASAVRADAVLGVMADLVSSGHLALHSADAEVQEALEASGAAGALPSPEDGDVVGVIANNAGANKLDFYTERTVEYHVVLEDEGRAQSTLAVRDTNRGPTSGAPTYVIGPNIEGFLPGENQTMYDVFCVGCALRSFTVDSGPATPSSGVEQGLTAFRHRERLRSGQTRELRYELHLTNAWRALGPRGTYALTVMGQATVRPTEHTITVIPPVGYTFVDGSAGWSIEPQLARYTGSVPHRWQGTLSLTRQAG
jgi:hypothetical protein